MNENRPPYVQFEMRPVEDREASIQAGHLVMRDIPFIILIPHGSEGRTSIEQPFGEWLQKMRPRAGREQRASGAGADTPAMASTRFPLEWLERIEKAFQLWLKGETMEVEGTPLRNWAVISKAMLKNCEGLHIYSVEALADASDEAVERLGMGGMNLRQQAKAYVAQLTGKSGQVVAQVGKLEAQVKALQAENERLKEELKAIKTQPVEA